MDAIESVQHEYNLHLDHRTGLHLHLGWTYQKPSELRRFIQLVRMFEPGLATLVSPSRVAEFDGRQYRVGSPNEYCRPISTMISARDLDYSDDWLVKVLRDRLSPQDGSRYTTVNLLPLLDADGPGTVEIRMHGGTTDASKMLLWLSLWQQILWAAGARAAIPDVPDREFLLPDSDVVILASKYLPEAGQMQQQEFLAKLYRRRREIIRLWEERTELRPWIGHAAPWKS